MPREDELLRIAVDLSPAGILAVDSAGRLLLVNREIERLFGWTRDELSGRPIEVLVPERYRSGHAHFRGAFFSAPQARPMGAGRELFALRRDGTEFPVEIGLNPVRLGEATVTLASIVDLTARYEADRVQRESDDRARQRQKLEGLGTLAGGVAHDFNNILLGIVGHTELVSQSPHLDAQARADLDQVLRAAERGRQLVQRILTFSRKGETRRAPLDLVRVMREAAGLLRSSLPTTIEMHVTLDPLTPTVYSDETQIHQLLMNLATNAAHAMNGAGVLTIAVVPFEVDAEYAAAHPGLQPGRHARVTVADTGSGMSPATKLRAFEPFFTTKPLGQGTGLGLSMVHGVVTEAGGVIDLHSEEGEGTQFDVVLPAADAVVAAPGDERAGEGGSRATHVLFVDDEETLGRMQQRLLQSFGYRVTLYQSPVEALEAFRLHPYDFDLLVTDNTMPKLTGLALAAEALKIRPDLPILMVSGIAESADAELLARAGVRRALRKPHTGRELDQAIREVLADRGPTARASRDDRGAAHR